MSPKVTFFLFNVGKHSGAKHVSDNSTRICMELKGLLMPRLWEHENTLTI
jgi:hypothetical protein